MGIYKIDFFIKIIAQKAQILNSNICCSEYIATYLKCKHSNHYPSDKTLQTSKTIKN